MTAEVRCGRVVVEALNHLPAVSGQYGEHFLVDPDEQLLGIDRPVAPA